MNLSYFWLENQDGAKVSLSPDADLILANIEGLGISNNDQFADVDDYGFRSVSRRRDGMQPIVGNLKYRPDAFERFRTLCDFLMSASALRLMYRPFGDVVYYRNVELGYVNKSNRSNGWMEAPISLQPLTPWYLPSNLRVIIGNSRDSISSRLPFPLDGSVRLAASASENYAATILPVGHIPASLRVEYTGAALNPVISLYGENSGELYGKCSIAGEFLATDTIILDTAYNDSKVVRVRGGVETDLINSVDLSDNPFFRVPLSEPCVIRLTAAEAMVGAATAEVRQYLRAV